MDAPERTCYQCGKPAKYCCPKCTTRSCSLPCVKEHKRRQECDGIRDKTAFLPLSEFTDLDLLSDYRFLEESSRVVDNAYREKPVLGIFPQQRNIPGFLHKFQNEAKRRGTDLKFLPKCFTKRQENRSCFNFKERCIYWQVAWEFVQANVKIKEEQSIHEKESLGRCLEKHLDGDQCKPELRSPLQFYQAAGTRGVCVLLAVEGQPASQPCYYSLDLSSSLEDCLKGKVIVEYPTFLVVLKEHATGFRIIKCEESGSASRTSIPTFFSNPNVSSGSSDEE
uniref:Putative box c/d snorna protein 1 n=2 Tax=Ixodes ricinus TaxID=34613 RepID=A0A131Y8R1_IXORI